MGKIQIKGDIVDNDTAEIYEWWGLEGYTSPKMVADALESAGNNQVTIEISSYGGYLTAASEIYSMLKGHTAGVVGEITGIAASAASIIAMAANPLKIAPTAQIMIHNASFGMQGNKFDFEKGKQSLESFDNSQLNAYEEKTGMDRAEIEALLNNETYLDAKKAVELGFADEVMFESEQIVMANAGNVITPETIAKMKSMKATAMAKVQIDLDELATKLAEKIQGSIEVKPEVPKPERNLLAKLAKNI